VAGARRGGKDADPTISANGERAAHGTGRFHGHDISGPEATEELTAWLTSTIDHVDRRAGQRDRLEVPAR
jgi:hypothetical protein